MECECGYPAEGTAHKRWHHSRYESGVRYSPELGFTEQIVKVPANRPTMAAKLAYRMARVAQRAGGYDFPSFPYPHSLMGVEDSWRKYRLTAYLYLKAGRAVGYVSVMESTDIGLWVKINAGYQGVQAAESAVTPVVNVVFVCKNHRRQGVARQMIEHIAKEYGIELTDVAWGPPFTAEGRALINAIRKNDDILVG